ncbi:MAG: hypothetical protein ACRCYY_10275 [Trueperaceae bacterium]
MIYVLLRPAGSSYLSQLISFPLATVPYLPFINSMPSFVHVFSFSLLTVAVLDKSKPILQSCLVWLTVNLSLR